MLHLHRCEQKSSICRHFCRRLQLASQCRLYNFHAYFIPFLLGTVSCTKNVIIGRRSPGSFGCRETFRQFSILFRSQWRLCGKWHIWWLFLCELKSFINTISLSPWPKNPNVKLLYFLPAGPLSRMEFHGWKWDTNCIYPFKIYLDSIWGWGEGWNCETRSSRKARHFCRSGNARDCWDHGLIVAANSVHNSKEGPTVLSSLIEVGPPCVPGTLLKTGKNGWQSDWQFCNRACSTLLQCGRKLKIQFDNLGKPYLSCMFMSRGRSAFEHSRMP